MPCCWSYDHEPRQSGATRAGYFGGEASRATELVLNHLASVFSSQQDVELMEAGKLPAGDMEIPFEFTVEPCSDMVRSQLAPVFICNARTSALCRRAWWRRTTA